MKKNYASEILQICHEDAQGLFEIGAISEDRMREFDEMCLENKRETASVAGKTANQSVTPAFAGPRT